MWTEGIAIGDLHTDKANLAKYFDDPLALQMKAVDKRLQYALGRGIRYVLFLGDICEYVQMSEAARVAFLRLLKKYDGRLEIYIILGNHDYAESGVHSLLSFIEMCRHGMFETVHVFDTPQIVELGKVPFHFLPYPHTKPLDKSPGVCVAHYEVRGAKRDNGRIIKEGDTPEFKRHMFIQGHLHTPQVVGRHVYAGTLYQMSFGETLDKGFLRFRCRIVDGQLEFKHKHVSIEPEFKLVNLVVEDKQDLKKITSDPTTRYKLFVQEDVSIPNDFLLKHTNIVNRLSFSSQEELQALENEEFALETQSIELSHERLLPNFLKKKLGLGKPQINRALELLDRFKK
jgi:DNA repair exonuclease SbcCD nuclease subunit